MSSRRSIPGKRAAALPTLTTCYATACCGGIPALVAPGGQASAQSGKRPPHLHFDGLSRDLHHLRHLGVAQVVVPAEPEYLLAPRGKRGHRALDRVLELGRLCGLIAAERRW